MGTRAQATQVWLRSVVLVLGTGAVLCFPACGSALGAEQPRISCILAAGSTGNGCPPFPYLQVSMGAAIAPRNLPRHERRPVALELSGKVATTDATHPPALREMVVDLDRDIALDSAGLPVCRRGGRRDIRMTLGQIAKLCRDAIVGRGRIDFEFAFPEQRPLQTASKVIVFNAATKGGSAHLVADAEVDVPAPTIVGMSIEVARAHKGDGQRAVVKVPPIAGGSGSLFDFRLRIRRSFVYGRQRESLVSARCSDGAFKLGFPKILFRNEALTPGTAPMTVMKGGLAIPCSVAD